MLILINNKFVSKKNAKISILSESFMYGYGVFETLRTYGNKKIFKEKEHLNRLFNSAKKIDLKIKHSKSQISEMLTKIVKKHTNKAQRIKIIAIKEGTILISTSIKIDKKIYKGVNCQTVQIHRALPEVKSLSYLASYYSEKIAEKTKCYEAIFTDKKGYIYEGARSNIFWFEKDILCTRKDNVLQGITAQEIIKISPFKTKFKKIKLNSLLQKKEIFLTQSIKGVVPVTKIDNKKIGTGKPGEKTKKIMELFNNQTKI
jgi:branched-chain amino acid aminotransferase